MRKIKIVLAGLAGFLGPVAALAPKAEPRRLEIPDIEAAITLCEQQNLTGWDLVTFAQRLVNDKYSHYSVWHLWLSPEQSFTAGQGLSLQYNQALAQLLRRLGFKVDVVQCARVRREFPRPWWLAGHVWLRVHYGSHIRDVCAGNGKNCPGTIDFVPVADVRPFRMISHLGLCTIGALSVAGTVWRSWLTGDQVPKWLYRSFTH